MPTEEYQPAKERDEFFAAVLNKIRPKATGLSTGIDVLLTLLREEGYPLTATAFEELRKWHADMEERSGRP